MPAASVMASDSDVMAQAKGIDAHHEHEETRKPDALTAEAQQGAQAEHKMSLLESIKTYPKAIGWSLLLSSTLIMEGYDLALLGNLYASPNFNKKYGTFQ